MPNTSLACEKHGYNYNGYNSDQLPTVSYKQIFSNTYFIIWCHMQHRAMD